MDKKENIEILAIGTEILTGHTVNTNAAYIAKHLMDINLEVSRQIVAPDAGERLKAILTEIVARASLVIVTGGLGPTCDDNTRQIVAQLLGCSFRFDEEIAAELAQRYGANLMSLKDQATVLHPAIILKNTIGTAPGFIVQKNQTTVILLPGIPEEMKVMLGQVLDYLKSHFLDGVKTFTRKCNFFGLTESTVDVVLKQLQSNYPEVEFGIYSSQGVLTVQVTKKSEQKDPTLLLLDTLIQTIKNTFSGHFFDTPSNTIEEAIHNLFCQHNWTLSCAESCTGGQLASALTYFPGSSEYFLGGIVPYSNTQKIHILGVTPKSIEEDGAVSARVVSQMAENMLTLANSDYSLAVSGIAGPNGGTTEKPVGTIWAAIAQRGRPPFVWKFLAKGNRQLIIKKTINTILGQLLKICHQRLGEK